LLRNRRRRAMGLIWKPCAQSESTSTYVDFAWRQAGAQPSGSRSSALSSAPVSPATRSGWFASKAAAASWGTGTKRGRHRDQKLQPEAALAAGLLGERRRWGEPAGWGGRSGPCLPLAPDLSRSRLKLTYHRTHRMMISRSKCGPLQGPASKRVPRSWALPPRAAGFKFWHQPPLSVPQLFMLPFAPYPFGTLPVCPRGLGLRTACRRPQRSAPGPCRWPADGIQSLRPSGCQSSS
jgi:hypothetical protein